MMHKRILTASISWLLMSSVLASDESELLLIEDESEEILLIEESEELILEPSEDSTTEEISVKTGEEETHADPFETDGSLFKVNKVWAEFGHFIDSDSAADNLGYLHTSASFNWSNENWEVKASARIDAYSETGDNNYDKTSADYDEVYIRYKTEQSILTLGAQKVIWGRIDEFPPTDRLSTQDFRRFVIDDLEDRRLASLAIRYEHFLESGKIDLMIYPKFREAQLPDRESIWFPVNSSGKILGLESTAATEALVKTLPVRENAPDSEGGFGIRYSSLGSDVDYAVTIQRGRSTLPYFAFNPVNNSLEGRYPRNWIVSTDIAFEALGGTLKFEGSWLSDTPITRKDGRYDTTKSVNWGVALEMFPGDGDGRLNLQIIGQNLLGAPSTIDRHDIYSFNGTYEIPFADNSWRAKTRFSFGLDEKDIYFNPELAYTGFDGQEIYLELHYVEGDEGTIGGFYEDNSALVLGWRAEF